jgi:hypothetical protein
VAGIACRSWDESAVEECCAGYYSSRNHADGPCKIKMSNVADINVLLDIIQRLGA